MNSLMQTRSGPAALSGNYVLTNARTDHDNMTEIEARHTFNHGYTLFGAYTHSSAHTNAAIDYLPAISYLGPQQSGPLRWDTPNRVLSWGWVPFLVPGLQKALGFRLHIRLAHRVSFHCNQCQLPGGGRGRLASVSQLCRLQPRP